MTTLLIVLIAVTHWVGDFVLQSRTMAVSKGSSTKWLVLHVLTYTATLAVVFGLFYGQAGILFALVNGVMHLGVDYNTSRLTARYFQKDWHKFFCVVGFDQMLHMICLIVAAAAIL